MRRTPWRFTRWFTVGRGITFVRSVEEGKLTWKQNHLSQAVNNIFGEALMQFWMKDNCSMQIPDENVEGKAQGDAFFNQELRVHNLRPRLLHRPCKSPSPETLAMLVKTKSRSLKLHFWRARPFGGVYLSSSSWKTPSSLPIHLQIVTPTQRFLVLMELSVHSQRSFHNGWSFKNFCFDHVQVWHSGWSLELSACLSWRKKKECLDLSHLSFQALNRHIRKTHNPPTQPAIQGGTTVALTDVNNLSWQQLQVLQAAGEESLKGAAGTQVKVIPAAGVMNLPVAAPEDATAPEVSFIETGSQQDGATEIQYIQQDVGGTQTLVETPHDVDMSDVQTIMVELPYGQELDANSIVSLLQQHQQWQGRTCPLQMTWMTLDCTDAKRPWCNANQWTAIKIQTCLLKVCWLPWTETSANEQVDIA